MNREEINHNKEIVITRLANKTTFIIEPSHSHTERMNETKAFDFYLELLSRGWQDEHKFYDVVMTNPHFPELP